MRIELVRFAHLDQGTLGKLTIPGGPTLYTVERPWKNNEPFISCIPSGVYPLEWDTTGRIKQVPRLRNTGVRTQINIHTANHAGELHGCIAPGLTWSIDAGTPMVLNSRAALELLTEFITNKHPMRDGDQLVHNGNPIVLDIRDFSTGV